MGFFKRDNKEDEIRKTMGADLQKLSEMIGDLQRDLAGKNAEIEGLNKQAADAAKQDASEDAAANKKAQDLTAQAQRRAGELSQTQSKLRELEKQLAEAQAGAQPPTAAAQPSVVAPQPAQQPGQPVQPTSKPGLAAGGTAYVAQAGGKSLRMRNQPGLETTVLDGLAPGTQMTLLGGPQEKDGYSWWNIRTADGREGWVAGNDLRTQPE
ncbi:MAG: SH3 domain-containing protein [Roseiflexaceae bacterium]|nr:SH3 domain-containing protein [Roseiflexaceae bacterium]